MGRSGRRTFPPDKVTGPPFVLNDSFHFVGIHLSGMESTARAHGVNTPWRLRPLRESVHGTTVADLA